MKKILIALDYDPFAETVAGKGYALAKALGAQVMLVHVVMEPAYYANTEYSPIMGFTGFEGLNTLEMMDDLKTQAEGFLEESRRHLGDDLIEIKALTGDFAEAILEAATGFNADLIVMGTHSRKGLDKLLMGNLAEKILNNTTIPLLAIPDNNPVK